MAGTHTKRQVGEDADSEPSAPDGHVCVFAPCVLMTITIEPHEDDSPRLHVHAGGQGFWVARLVTRLGGRAELCSTFGGEPGTVLRTLASEDDVEVHGVPIAGDNGAYVHDRRGGERDVVVETEQHPLDRHELDELYTMTLGVAIDCGVCVLAGCVPETLIPLDTYQRLASDLRENGVVVVADLSNAQLASALEGRLHLLKVSHEELIESGWATSDDRDELLQAMRRLHAAGADEILVSRAAEPALAYLDGGWYEVAAPQMTVIDHRGAGDSMTAAFAIAKSRGLGAVDTLKLAAGAGALNVTRHGLGSGDARTIAKIAEKVTVTPIRDPARAG